MRHSQKKNRSSDGPKFQISVEIDTCELVFVNLNLLHLILLLDFLQC